jgi:hypothetical protein
MTCCEGLRVPPKPSFRPVLSAAEGAEREARSVESRSRGGDWLSPRLVMQQPLIARMLVAIVAVVGIATSLSAGWCASPMVEGELLWKARHFDRIIQERHVLDGGLVIGGVRLPYDPNVVETNENGAYETGAYLAALSFRFAATKDPPAQDEALACFRCFQKLVAVTGQKGLLARWYKRASKPSPAENEGWLSNAWHQSGDYRWLGNVSTDQYCGALFGLAIYHQLAAPAAVKPEVESLVADMVGRILDAGMVINDIDGKPTSWSDMSPQGLQEPLYALMGLGFLRVAAAVTGQARFEREYDRLLNEENYATRAIPKNRWLSDWNFSDDVMAWEMLYHLLLLEKRPAEKAKLAAAADGAWTLVKGQKRALFDIVRSITTDDKELGASAVHQLFLMPADKIEVQGRQRATAPVDLNLRPPAWFEWVDNPYESIVGIEWTGVDYLVAYWMARYHGLVGGGER